MIPLVGFNQKVVRGEITDEKGGKIPGARVAIENSTYAVPSNYNGDYFIEVTNTDTVILKVSMIGYETRIDTVVLSFQTNLCNIVLEQASKSLNTVEIYANKRDIAKEVIERVMENKKVMLNQYEAYRCKTYIKTSLEKERRFAFLDEITKDTPPEEKKGPAPVISENGREKMNFIESNSITSFKQKSTYKELILAHQDYSDKTNAAVVVSADFSDPNSILPTQSIEYNPYIFFEKVQDGDFNLYENLISLPKISSNPIVSPLAINGFINYKFILNGTFIEDGQKIYDIQIEPRFSQAPLFSGNLYIIDSLWVIKSMDLKVNPSSMAFFKEFRLIQDYEYIQSKWMIVRREFDYAVNDGADIVVGNTRVHHSSYEINPTFKEKEFKNVIMIYEEDAFDKDSAYWEIVRPIQLKPTELRFVALQDSIENVVNSDAYVDSVNTEYNQITFWDIALNGVGFRNRIKKQEIYINPLISQIQPLGIGGYRHRLGGYYSKEFENAQSIKVDGQIDYGFRNKDVKGKLGVEYLFLPKHFGSFKISGGDIYDFITMEQSIVGFFSRGNYVRKTFVNLSQRYEIVNGLYGRLSLDFSTRRDISNVQSPPWVDTLVQLGLWQKPKPYETYTVSIVELELLYRFKQAYIVKGNKKLIIGTEYPELRLRYKRGIPTLFGSDVNFDFIEVGASDKVTFGSFGELKWDVEAGSFLGKNVDEVQFIEQRFFRGSDLFFFSDPLNTLQLLDSTFNTARPYAQVFAIHHFNGFIMNKVPLINKLKLELVAGLGGLFIEDLNYSHVEFYGGIERKFKIKKQLFKASLFYVVRENNAASINFNFKVGIDFFNSFTNSWSY